MKNTPALDAILAATHEDLLETPGHVDVARIARILRSQGRICGTRDLLELTHNIRAAITGYGPLQHLVQNTTTDILVNGPLDIWFDNGTGLQRAENTHFDTTEELRHFAIRLAASAGRRLDDASPYVDARLPDGTRYHAVLPPLGVEGPFISLRFPSDKHIKLSQWVHNPTLYRIVHAMVQQRVAFLISGGTGTGKTTLLSAMLSEVPETERIVIVEDSTELNPQHPHTLHLQSRQANVEGVGTVDLVALVRQTLRMRPDRVVLGECRGAELRELLQALNTGHEGGCGTLHANTALDVPARIEALGALAGLNEHAIASQAASAIDAIIHVTRDEHGHRRIQQIACLSRNPQGTLTATPAVTVTDNKVHFEAAWGTLSQRLRWVT